jgi:hypothetical protein
MGARDANERARSSRDVVISSKSFTGVSIAERRTRATVELDHEPASTPQLYRKEFGELRQGRPKRATLRGPSYFFARATAALIAAMPPLMRSSFVA